MTSNIFFKFSAFFGVLVVVAIIVFGFLFFEPFLTEKVETITVINKEKWPDQPGRYFIFTQGEVFLNENNYYHNKENADQLYPLIRIGYTYKVKVVGLYWPFLPRFRNIMNIVEQVSAPQ